MAAADGSGTDLANFAQQVQTYAADGAGVIGAVSGLAGSFKAFFNNGTVTPLSAGVAGPAAAGNTPTQFTSSSSGELGKIAAQIGLPVWAVIVGGLSAAALVIGLGWKFFFSE